MAVPETQKNTGITPSGGTVFEIQGQLFKEIPQINLQEMNEQQLFSYICGPLLDAENKMYTNGNTGYHKLIFTGGGAENDNDITACLDLDGKPIYTHTPDYTKYPEIAEFNAAVLNYSEFPKGEREAKKEEFGKLKVKVVSEVADIFHNLVTLTKLDDEREKSYLKWINQIASTLGYSVRDCLLLSASKYKKRLIDIGRKDLDEEENAIKELITPDASGETLISFPGGDRLRTASRTINRMGKMLIHQRIDELTTFHEWNKSKESQAESSEEHC